MNEEKIIYILRAMRAITPRTHRAWEVPERAREPHYVPSIRDWARSILAPVPFSPAAVLTRSFKIVSFSLIGLTMALAVYAVTQELSPLFLPGLNQNKIAAEAEAINATINIEFDRIERFDIAAQESAQALSEAGPQAFSHLNETIIQREAQRIERTTQQPSYDVNDEIHTILRSINE